MAEPSKNPVLYLSYDGLTDPLGQSQILPYLVGLSKLGWKFTIISFEKSEAFRGGQAAIFAICKQNGIDWVPLPYTKHPPVLSTVFDLVKLWFAVRKHLRKNPNAFIHCRSYLTTLIAVSMKKQFNTKVIFDMRGFWADERVEGGLWNLKNPVFKIVYKFFKKKERNFLVQADHIISLTQNAKKEIESWNLPSAPITVIPTCVDVELFDSKNINEYDKELLRSKLGIRPDEFVMLYLGSWGTWYLTSEMLSAFRALLKLKPESRFLIVTPNKVEFGQQEFGDAILVTYAERKDVPLYISIASMSIFFIKPSFSKKASSATKLGELLAMDKCVLTNSGWGDAVEMPQVAIVNDFTESKLKSGLLQVFDKMAKGQKANISHLSLETGIESYHQVYNSLM